MGRQVIGGQGPGHGAGVRAVGLDGAASATTTLILQVPEHRVRKTVELHGHGTGVVHLEGEGHRPARLRDAHRIGGLGQNDDWVYTVGSTVAVSIGVGHPTPAHARLRLAGIGRATIRTVGSTVPVSIGVSHPTPTHARLRLAGVKRALIHTVIPAVVVGVGIGHPAPADPLALGLVGVSRAGVDTARHAVAVLIGLDLAPTASGLHQSRVVITTIHTVGSTVPVSVGVSHPTPTHPRLRLAGIGRATIHTVGSTVPVSIGVGNFAITWPVCSSQAWAPVRHRHASPPVP